MSKIFSIFICLFFFISVQSAAQVVTKQDSLKIKIELKRISDSTRIALKKVALKKRQDSIAQIIQIRQIARKRAADSTRILRKQQRDALKKQNKEFNHRKKERADIRDSIRIASEQAAKARKAYLKSHKKQIAKTATKKKEGSIKRRKVKTIAKTKKEPKKNKSVEKKKLDKKRTEKAELARKEKEKKELAKYSKRKKDSIARAIKIENKNWKRKQKTKNIIISEDTYNNGNYQTIERIRKPPVKKQSYFAFQLGHSNYLGDLGGNSRLENNFLGDLSFKDNTFFYGFSYSQLRREAFGIRFSYVFGEISGSDKNTFFKNTSDPSYARFVRNLDFKTIINEGSMMFELYPLKFLSYRKKLHHSFLQPYGLVGLGRYRFNPQGSYFDTDIDKLLWYDLQPLSIEGQGMQEFPDREPYKLTQWNIPYGIGFNYEISPTVTLGLEYVGRVLFTDYLDDVSTNYINPTLFSDYFDAGNAQLATDLNNKSKLIDAGRAYKPGEQRGNPENNDFYFSISARLIIKISKNKNRTTIIKPIYKYDDSEICD